MSSCLQCFICRQWTWDVCETNNWHVPLCLPCYVDVLEVRQARGVMGAPLGGIQNVTSSDVIPEATKPGNSPSLFGRQIEMFD